ncbi:MAG: D-alanine--D-alanine ligase [Clostridia bacterium]|nr:D-alanine--D-alanine ligase [Clostridia bacterium]
MRKIEEKRNVIVLFGGKSVEHDISIITGVQTLNAINKRKNNIIPIYITKNGEFLSSEAFFNIKTFSNNNLNKINYKKVILTNDSYLYFYKGKKLKQWLKVDFVFLATHGGLGENGELQGFLDICNIAYSSSNVLSSSIGMNKLVAKQILSSQQINQANYFAVNQKDFNKNTKIISQKVKEMGFPIIVKPASLGSSIGISFCKTLKNVKNAISFAFLFDKTVIVEKAVENLREFNISAIGNEFECELSDIEEVLIKKDILSFENKYLNKESSSKGMENTTRNFPAEINYELEKTIKDVANKVYFLLNCKGVVRFDFLVNDKTQEVYFNEVNTIPGSLSNYLWTKKGYNFEKLLDKIMDYCLESKKNKESKVSNFSSNVLKQFKNSSKLDFKK